MAEICSIDRVIHGQSPIQKWGLTDLLLWLNEKNKVFCFSWPEGYVNVLMINEQPITKTCFNLSKKRSERQKKFCPCFLFSERMKQSGSSVSLNSCATFTLFTTLLYNIAVNRNDFVSILLESCKIVCRAIRWKTFHLNQSLYPFNIYNKFEDCRLISEEFWFLLYFNTK